MTKDIKKIFKLSVARELSDMGHTILFTQDNKDREGFKVFCFMQTESLLEDLTFITARDKAAR